MTKKVSLLIIVVICAFALLVGCANTDTPPADNPADNPNQQEPATTGEYDSYPERSIEFVIGWGAGGGTDTFARTINTDAAKVLGGNIVAVNMEGGSSAMAMEYVLQQPADGYTVLAITSDILPNTCMGRTSASYEDLMPIIMAHVDIGCWEVRGDSPYKTWDELVAYLTEHPGEVMLGVNGSASNDEFFSYYVLNQLGLEVTFVPYESASDMRAALLGGHLDMIYEEPGNVIEMINSGDMIPIVFFCEDKVEAFPDVPSLGELELDVPPLLWRGIAVKAGTPDEIVQKLIDAYIEAWNCDGYQEFAEGRYLNLYGSYQTGQEFYETMEREAAIYDKIVTDMGYK